MFTPLPLKVAWSGISLIEDNDKQRNTDHRKVHDFEDPDGEGEVYDDNHHKEQQEDVEASFPPAVDADLIDDLGVRRGGPPPLAITRPATHQQLWEERVGELVVLFI